MASTRPSSAAPLAAALLAALALGGCGERDRTWTVHEVRERKADRPPVPLDVSTVQRLTAGADAHGGGAPEQERGATFAWNTPTGWQELPGDQMREATWRIEGEPETDAALSILPQTGGGLAANVNRWRKQMGLEPLDETAVAALPKRELLGGEATFLDLRGTYVGMGQGTSLEGARMLGLILSLPRVAVFLKLVGPADALEGQETPFLRLAASIRPAEVPAGHPPMGDGEAAPPPPPAEPPPATLAWTAPAEWLPQPARMMREVTFVPRGSTNTECYVTILGGDGGGLAMNLNRWQDQVGQPHLSDAEIAALPRIRVLGQEVPLLKARGHFTGMGDASVEDAALLGVVVIRGGEAVFVKMTGPADVVLAEEQRFVEFCESLREAR